MRLLLDTHVVPWRLGDDGRLPGRFRDAMIDADNDVFVSAVSVAESAIKASLGKLDAPDDVVGAVPASGFEHLAFTSAHAARLRTLVWHHRDPFDRMLVAQARDEGVTLLSVDARVAAYF